MQNPDTSASVRPPIWRTLALLLLALVATGCRNGRSGQSGAGAQQVFRIGYQKGSALHLLRITGELDRRLAAEGVKVEWLPFTSAPPMLEAIGVGSLDLGSGGDAPIVFAQAAGYSIALLANTPPGDNNSRAVIVPKDSPIRSLADLKGKRVAISKGTGTHNYFIQVLDHAGLAYSEIVPAYLAPPDARAAFDGGKVDAWAAWDPYLTVARKATGARVIANGGGIITAGGFYFSTRKFAKERPTWIRTALEEVDKKGVWLWQHPREAAEKIAPQLGVDAATIEALNRNAARGSEYVGFRPLNEDIVEAQQVVADNFYRIGLLPKKVNVRETLLTPTEYTALLPTQKVSRKDAKTRREKKT